MTEVLHVAFHPASEARPPVPPRPCRSPGTPSPWLARRGPACRLSYVQAVFRPVRLPRWRLPSRRRRGCRSLW